MGINLSCIAKNLGYWHAQFLVNGDIGTHRWTQIKINIKFSLSSHWILEQSFAREFFYISFVWICSQIEVSQTKLMQKRLIRASYETPLTRKTKLEYLSDALQRKNRLWYWLNQSEIHAVLLELLYHWSTEMSIFQGIGK